MSSILRRIEKNIIKKMGVSRDVASGLIVDSDGRIVGRNGGKNYPRFNDIKVGEAASG